jgi:hypothetical protein
MVPNATTYALRFGSVVAALALFVLLVAPGSRAEDTMPQDALMVPREAGSEVTTGSPSVTVAPTTSTVPNTAPASTAPAPASVPAPASAPTPTAAAKPAAPVTPRVLSVFDFVGVTIDRGQTWIAIATVTIVDQTGSPAADVEVAATWSVGATPASCRTDSTGKCSMYQSPLPADVAQTTISISAPQAVTRTIQRPSK